MQRVQQQDETIPHDGYVEDKDLLFYYDKLFPFRELSLWLTYGNQSHLPESETNDPLFLAKREVCLTCRRPAAAARGGGRSSSSAGDRSSSSSADEFFLRWQSFRTVEALKERLKDMTDLVAFKFDIGAVYSLPVSEKDCFPSGFKAGQKELVFDIDMNDYDDVRTCCKDKQVCRKCWLFLELAMLLLDTALREDFNFENILWVFSGRRGVHCWVCDSAARLLPSEARAHLCEYLNLCTGTSQQAKKVSLRPRPLGAGGGGGAGGRGGAFAAQHHFVDRAFCIAYKHFSRLLQEQDFFNDLPSSLTAAAAGREAGGTAAAFDLLPEGKERVSYNYEKLLGYLPDHHEDSSSSSSYSSSSSWNSSHHASRASYSSSSSINGSSRDSASSGVLQQVHAFIKRKQQRQQQLQQRRQQQQQQGESRRVSAAAASSTSSASAQPLTPSYSSVELFNALCLAAACPLPDQFDGSPAALKSIPFYIKEIVLSFSYPRLDINVSKDIGHLLKSPFCVHPGTGRICVPLKPPHAADSLDFAFDPGRVPTLKLLRQQFDEPSRAHLPPDERTSLARYVRLFRDEFLQKLQHAIAEENKYVRQLLNAADASVKPEICF